MASLLAASRWLYVIWNVHSSLWVTVTKSGEERGFLAGLEERVAAWKLKMDIQKYARSSSVYVRQWLNIEYILWDFKADLCLDLLFNVLSRGQSQREAFVYLDVAVLFNCRYLQHESSHTRSPPLDQAVHVMRGKRVYVLSTLFFVSLKSY